MKRLIIFLILVIILGSIGYIYLKGVPSWLPFGGSLNVPAPMPSLERPLAFPDTFPAEARTLLENKVQDLRTKLAADQGDYYAWLDLAIQYKTISDYTGAQEIWEYLADAYPNDGVSVHNLGNLYHYDLKQYEKAEENFKEAIKRDPNQSLYYQGLHELYKYSYKKDTNAAAEVLEQGIAAVPDAIDLMTTFATYYKEKGDKENAAKYYTQARNVAQMKGNSGLVRQLDAEIAALQ